MPDLRPWPLRMAWLVLPLAAGPALAAGLDQRDQGVRTVATLLLWAGWATGVLAILVPRTVGLTAVRTLAPASLVAVGWAAITGSPTLAHGVAAGASALAVATAFSPLTGDAFVDGSSYGNERRLALRPPSALLLGPVPLTWAVAVTGLVAGPLLLGARRWALGAVATVVGGPLAVAGLRSLHQLARRWVVFVPNGMVLHDPISQPEPTLFLRRSIRRLGPAPADTTALDLTGGAAGLALQIELTEPTTMLVRRGRRHTETLDATAVAFTPTRPAALLEEAARRRMGAGAVPER